MLQFWRSQTRLLLIVIALRCEWTQETLTSDDVKFKKHIETFWNCIFGCYGWYLFQQDELYLLVLVLCQHSTTRSAKFVDATKSISNLTNSGRYSWLDNSVVFVVCWYIQAVSLTHWQIICSQVVNTMQIVCRIWRSRHITKYMHIFGYPMFGVWILLRPCMLCMCQSIWVEHGDMVSGL